MGHNEFWLQFNNGKKEQFNDTKHGVRKEQVDKKFHNLFDAYDINNDGTLEENEVQTIFGHLKNFAGDNVLDSSENLKAKSVFADQVGMQDVDFQGFVKSVSDATSNIISSEETKTSDGGKEIKTEYKDGTTETIAYYSNGDFKWKKIEKRFAETIYEMVKDGKYQKLTEEQFKEEIKKQEVLSKKPQKLNVKKGLDGNKIIQPIKTSTVAVRSTTNKWEEHTQEYSPRFIAEKLGVDINTEEGKKILERMSYLPKEGLDQIKDGAELKDIIAQNDLPPNFDNISNVLELMYGVTLRNDEEYEASKPQREKIIQQIQTVGIMSELYARVAEYYDTYTDNQGLSGMGSEGIQYILNKTLGNIDFFKKHGCGENHYQWADSCREFIEKINDFKVLNPTKFEQEFKELTGKDKFNVDALQKMVELAKDGKAQDENGDYTDEYKQAVKEFSNFDVTNINARAWYHPLNLLNGFGEVLAMIATLGWGAETKAGQMLATSTMATFSKAGVAIASKQVNNKLLQGVLRLSGKGVKLLGPMINEGTKMYAYTAVTGTATNVANRTIKFDSEDNTLGKFLETEGMVLDGATGSFGFGAFAGAFGSTVTQKVMQRASKVSQKVGTALSDKFAKGAVDANEVFTTILEKSAPTKIAEAAAFVTDVLGFTAFESVLAIVNNLDNYPDGYSVEDLTNIIWEELKSQGYNLGQIKIVAWLMSSRSARMQATRYMKDAMPQLRGATVEGVNGGKDGYKINLPDGRKIECKNATEYISALHLMVRNETAFSSKFDVKNKDITETIKPKIESKQKPIEAMSEAEIISQLEASMQDADFSVVIPENFPERINKNGIELVKNNNGEYDIYDENGSNVGYCVITDGKSVDVAGHLDSEPKTWSDENGNLKPYLEIGAIFISVNQGKGVGRKTIQTLYELSNELGYEGRIHLEQFEEANGFYTKLGFLNDGKQSRFFDPTPESLDKLYKGNIPNKENNKSETLSKVDIADIVSKVKNEKTCNEALETLSALKAEPPKVEEVKVENVEPETKTERTSEDTAREILSTLNTARELVDKDGNKVIIFHRNWLNAGDWSYLRFDKEGKQIGSIETIAESDFEKVFGEGNNINKSSKLNKSGTLMMSLDMGIVESLAKTLKANIELHQFNNSAKASESRPRASEIIEDKNAAMTENEVLESLRDFGFNDKEISEIKNNIKNIDKIVKIFSFGKKHGMISSNKDELLKSFYQYDQHPEFPKENYCTEENYDSLKDFIDLSDVKPEDFLTIMAFIKPNMFESIKKYSNIVEHKLTDKELNFCLNCTNADGTLHENALKLSEHSLAIYDCKDKDGNFDDTLIDFAYDLLQDEKSKDLKCIPSEIMEVCKDKNGHLIKENVTIISKYCKDMGIRFVADGIRLANGKINEQILNSISLKKDKHIGLSLIQQSLIEISESGEYKVNPDAVELYFKWLDLGIKDDFDFQLISRACQNEDRKFDKSLIEFTGKLIDATIKKMEAVEDYKTDANGCTDQIINIVKLIKLGKGTFDSAMSKSVMDAIPKFDEYYPMQTKLRKIAEVLDASVSENGFNKSAFDKAIDIVNGDPYALSNLMHKTNGSTKAVICEKAIDLYNALCANDSMSSLFSFYNLRKPNGEFDEVMLEAAIQLTDTIKGSEVGDLPKFAAVCVQDGKVNAEKIKTIKFIKSAKLSDLKDFVSKYADEDGYIDTFKLMAAVKKLGFGIDFANYIKVANYEPESIRYAELLKDNGYSFSEIGQLIDSFRQCVTNAGPRTILTESDYQYLNKLASLHIPHDKFNKILYRCMNGFDSETLFSSEKLKTVSELLTENPALESTFSNHSSRVNDNDIIMPVKTFVDKLKEKNIDQTAQDKIYRTLTDENVEFALEHIENGDIPLEHLANMLKVINIRNKDWNFIKQHIQKKDVPFEYLPQIIEKIRVSARDFVPKDYDSEPCIVFANELIKNERLSWEEKLEIQDNVSSANANLARELCNNPEFSTSIIREILKVTDSNNCQMAEELCKNYKRTEVPIETIPALLMNAEKISYKDIQKLIHKIGREKASKLSNEDLIISAQFVDIMGKSDINEISIAGKRKLLRDLVASNTGVFNISEDIREMFPLLPKDQQSYCELLPAIVRSLGIETKTLTTEQTGEYYQAQADLSTTLADISDSDFAQLHITQEYSKDDFINTVLVKVKDLSIEERQKVFDYFGFELHHNKKGTQGKYSITGYPVNLNNGHKLAMITEPKTKAVVEDLRPDVVRFSEHNPIRCENKQVEKLLNEIAEAIPEIRTMIGKIQHETHDFDVIKHSLKVMQKIAQDPNFKQLNESDKKIMLLASLMHDISKGEGFSDRMHATEGSFDTFFIAKKFNLTQEEEIKLYTLIRHHEWLSFVNTAKTETEQIKRLQSVAYDLQQDNLLDMAMIFTHADLKAVKSDDSFHDRTDGSSRRTVLGSQRSFGESTDVYIEKMRNLVNTLKNSQPLLPVTPIPKASSMRAKITVVNNDGSTNIKGVYINKDGLMIIKFNEVENWEELGFPNGTSSKGIMATGVDGRGNETDVETGNIKWFAHGLDYPNQLAKFDAFGLVDSDVLLSVSYTERPESKYRFFRTQGVILDVATKYVHGGGNTDSGSGCGKSIQDFKNRYIFGGERESDRLYISNMIKEATGMSDAEYVEFVRRNENKSFTEIEPVEYREKIIKAFATINSNTRKGDRAYNEMYASNPQVMAVFAYSPSDKVGNVMDFYSSSADRLDFLKDFALKKDIPMIVFGD